MRSWVHASMRSRAHASMRAFVLVDGVQLMRVLALPASSPLGFLAGSLLSHLHVHVHVLFFLR